MPPLRAVQEDCEIVYSDSPQNQPWCMIVNSSPIGDLNSAFISVYIDISNDLVPSGNN